MKNGTSHVPVAPSNPNKPLFQGQSIYIDQYQKIIDDRKNSVNENKKWLKKNL